MVVHGRRPTFWTRVRFPASPPFFAPSLCSELRMAHAICISPALGLRSEECPPKLKSEGGLFHDYTFGMFYVYLLRSISHPSQTYVGFSQDLKNVLRLTMLACRNIQASIAPGSWRRTSHFPMRTEHEHLRCISKQHRELRFERNDCELLHQALEPFGSRFFVVRMNSRRYASGCLYGVMLEA